MCSKIVRLTQAKTMLAILKDYLATAVTTEMNNVIINAHRLFDILEVPDYEKGFEEILMLDDNVDQGSTQTSIIELTKTLQHKVLLEHGITLVEDAQIETLSIFIKGILDIQDYEDNATIMKVASIPGMPEEVFAEILALVTTLTVEELMDSIESVNQLVVTRICNLFSDYDQEQTSEQEQMAQIKYKNMYTLISELYPDAVFSITAYLQNGLDLGYPFLIYINLIGSELEDLPVELAALNLFMICMISEDGIVSPRAVIHEHIQKYIFDIDKITKIDIEIGNLLMKLNNSIVGGIRAQT